MQQDFCKSEEMNKAQWFWYTVPSLQQAGDTHKETGPHNNNTETWVKEVHLSEMIYLLYKLFAL